MQIINALIALVSAAVIVRIIPHLWSKGMKKTVYAIVVTLLTIVLGNIFSSPLPVPGILLQIVLPTFLILGLFFWYASVEMKWDKESRIEVETAIQTAETEASA